MFLDVNASCFRSVTEYFEELAMASPHDLPDPACVDEGNEVFFGSLLTILGLNDALLIPIDSCILKEEGYERDLCTFLAEDDLNGNLKLLYRGSRDGFDASQFHMKCDNGGPTVTVVKSTEGGFVFGGYFDKSWSSIGGHASSSDAFLFSLKSQCGIGATKMRIKNGNAAYAVYNHSQKGPVFGQDLIIGKKLNKLNDGISSIGLKYVLPPGLDNYFLTGRRTFSVAEIEVFRVGSDESLGHGRDEEIVTSTEDGEEWPTLAFDDFPASIKTAIEEEKKAWIAAKYELQRQIRAFQLEKPFIETFVKGKTEDIIRFDVRGECVQVRRSTLGQFEESVLAKQFHDPLWRKDRNLPPVEKWNAEQVLKWASERADFSDDVVRKLKEHQLTGSEILLFGRDDLKEIGITRPGTLATVMSGIEKLKKNAHGDVIFVDQNPYCFGKMIDQLRLHAICRVNDRLWPDSKKDEFCEQGLKRRSPPRSIICEHEEKRFKRTVDYYFPGEEASSFIFGTSL